MIALTKGLIEAWDDNEGFVVKRSTYYEDQAKADDEGQEEAMDDE